MSVILIWNDKNEIKKHDGSNKYEMILNEIHEENKQTFMYLKFIQCCLAKRFFKAL